MGCFGNDFDGDEIPYQKEIDTTFTGSVKGRTTTDGHYLVLLILSTAALGGVTLYCTINGDSARFFNGYDNCGNVCGMKNAKEDNPKFACKGEDMTNKKYLLFDIPTLGELDDMSYTRRCVENCDVEPNHFELLHRCIPKSVNETDTAEQVGEWVEAALNDLDIVRGDIVKLSVFALVLSLILVYLLRLKPELMVWVLLIGFTAVSLLFTIALWVIWMDRHNNDDINAITPAEKKENKTNNFFVLFAIISSTVTIGVIAVILVMRKRIALVVRLFKEAGKAIEDMPLLLVQPLMTFVAIMLVLAGYVFIAVQIQGGGFLTQDPLTEDIYYKMDSIMQFASWFDLFMWFWLVQFCIGCQHMIIAGSAATWFFTRNKDQLRSPIGTASSNLFSYHLGSVAIGSLLIAIIQMIRAIFASIKFSMKYSKSRIIRMLYVCIEVAFVFVESLLRYWTRNAYVQVAMFGIGFCEGGSRAFKLLTSNAMRVTAINSVGDFVLFLGKLLVVAFTVFLGFNMIDSTKVQHLWVPLTVVGLIAYVIVHCFLTVYEMVIDTIFLCFCEDCEINDGESKPYFMSAGLMEFVESSTREFPKASFQTPVNA